MCSKVEPYFLHSYFNRIFYNHDNLFIFRKQFTKYHATHSLFAYAFNQFEQLKLSNFSFCKATGCLNSNTVLLRDTVANYPGPGKDFETFEKEQFKPTADSALYLPFRLTPNLVYMMGQIGLHGIFAGVMTSASLALTAHESKLVAML